MGRLPELPFAALSAEQQRILGPLPISRLPIVEGPGSVLIRLPEVCEAMRDLALRLRYRSRIEDRLFELAVLTVARDRWAQYEWAAHEPGARRAGLSEAVIAAVKRGDAEPPFERDDERLVFELARELHATRRIRDVTYARAEAALGAEGLIELVAAMGFYHLIATVLNAFDVPVPDGRPPFDEPPPARSG